MTKRVKKRSALSISMSTDNKSPVPLPALSFVAVNGDGRAGFTDLSLDLGNGLTLKNIVVWSSDDGKLIRLVVGADDRSIGSLWRILRERRTQGHIKFAESFKIKR
jgi:hypothetical protein